MTCLVIVISGGLLYFCNIYPQKFVKKKFVKNISMVGGSLGEGVPIGPSFRVIYPSFRESYHHLEKLPSFRGNTHIYPHKKKDLSFKIGLQVSLPSVHVQ